MTTRSFHVGDVLSIVTGRLVSPEHIGGVYKILNWMTGDDLMTHQLPRAARECEGSLREQFPDLAEIEVPEELDSEEKVLSWLVTITDQYGTHRDVTPLDPADHTRIDPITEIGLLAPGVPIIVVQVEETEEP